MKFRGIFLLLIVLDTVCSEDIFDPYSDSKDSYSNVTVKNIVESCEHGNCIRICNTSQPLTKVNVSVENEEFMVVDLVAENFTIIVGDAECQENHGLYVAELYEFLKVFHRLILT